MKPQRTVTHLACYGEGEMSWPQAVAICDDGTAWELVLASKSGPGTKWEPLPSIPGTQPEAAE